MRWLVAGMLTFAVFLSGCAGDPKAQAADDLAADTDVQDNATGNATLPTGNATGNSTGNATGNVTVPGNSTGNATNATAEPVLVFEQSYSGTLPVDGLSGPHAFTVPAGATLVEVVYTSTHVGLFTALATVTDGGGTERVASSDECGFGNPGAATDTCLMAVDKDVGAGEWTAEVFWQAGQAIEEYTLDVRVFAIPA